MTCEGTISPFKTKILGTIRNIFTDPTLAIEGSLDGTPNPKIRWTTGYGWPFDDIADWLIGDITKKELRKLSKRSIELFSKPLSEFGDVLDSSNLNVYRLESDADPTNQSQLYSVTASVAFAGQ